ncbi:MAG: LPXTG cell wall anchor domain-containing protein [bacterium]
MSPKKAILSLLILLLIGAIIVFLVFLVLALMGNNNGGTNNSSQTPTVSNTITATTSTTIQVSSVKKCTFDTKEYNVDNVNIGIDGLGRCTQLLSGACMILYPDNSTQYNSQRKLCECKLTGYVTEFGANSEIRCKSSTTSSTTQPSVQPTTLPTTKPTTNPQGGTNSTSTPTKNPTQITGTIIPQQSGKNNLPNTGFTEDLVMYTGIGLLLISFGFMIRKISPDKDNNQKNGQ